jgi:hypothetical protein
VRNAKPFPAIRTCHSTCDVSLLTRNGPDCLVFPDQKLLDVGYRVVGAFQLCGEFVCGQVTEAGMRSDGVVVQPPGFDDGLGFGA